MIESVRSALRERREELTAGALERLTDRSAWTEGDLKRLLDLTDDRSRPAMLDAIETEGWQLAQLAERLDVRMESFERTADALGGAIDQSFAQTPELRVAAREALRFGRRTGITALARGFQSAVESISLTERDRGRFVNGRFRAMQRLNSVINSGLDFNETLNNATKVIADELRADLCAIFLYDQMGAELRLHTTNRIPSELPGNFTVPLDQQVTGFAVQQGVPYYERDLLALDPLPIETQIFGRRYHSAFVIPIIYFSGEAPTLEGALTLLNEDERVFNLDDRSFLELVAGMLALSIENTHIYQRTDELVRRQVANIQTLQRVSASVATSFDLARVLSEIVLQAAQLTGSSHGAIFRLDQTGGLELAERYNLNTQSLSDVELHLAMGNCCIGRAAEQMDPAWGMDCMRMDETCFFRRIPDQIADAYSSLALPLVSKGQIQGVLCLLNNNRHLQPKTQERMAITFANEAAVAIESTLLHEETLRSLEMKSHLLQEMHHRVKNNLLSIAAILRMELRRTREPEASHVLAESISRIDGMAATHDLLSREERIGTAKVGDIAIKLIGVVSAHLVPPTLRIEFENYAATSNVEVHSKNALVLALIINELLANAIEHGFADRDQGRLRVGAWEEEGQAHFVIADDGVGLAPGLDLAASSRLGLSLVRDMTRDQLHGTFTLRSEPMPLPLRADPADETRWTVAELIFPPETEGFIAVNTGET